MQVNEVRVKGRVMRTVDAFENGVVADALYFTLSVPLVKKPDKCVFVDCVAFPETYEQFSGYLEAGEEVLLEGSLVFRTWTDAKGVRRSGIEACADIIEIEGE